MRKAGGADTDGVDEFAKYLETPEQLGDKAVLEKLVKNRFLGTLSRGVDNAEFTKGLKDPNVVKQLQEFSDAEEDRVLKTLAEYSPYTFATRLNDIAKLLPK